ncbi:type III secretion system HrpP C-terminal domain-containing protein [Pseudomonas deceptionensis]|uniref:Flagellar hook-length control protein FliK n=1 Tax=Pseudomonas deceptionensis TaxID=882211 RepID=A0A1H5GF04_PSEDM|nr:type III secretion system HrpP C-terminal domain-containing protein [Pseudomonas deceptionensis]SEE14303.1 hypothetical protein SAMN04489800_0036 [Pseudomonas deceptionensis]
MTELSVLTPQRADLRQYPRDSGPLRRIADSKLFNALLVPGGQGSPPDTRLENTAQAAEFAQAMSEQLMPRLGGSGHWPLQFVICLARCGRITVSARQERQGWSVWLDAERADTGQWLAGQLQRCQQSLARRLGQPVRLELMQGVRR